MKKISGILPATQRVTSVDLSKARPVRPGAPGYGPAGENGLSARDKISRATADERIQGFSYGTPGRLTWKHRDLAKADIVNKLSASFFRENQKPADTPSSGGVDTGADLSVDNIIKSYEKKYSDDYLSDYSDRFGANSYSPSRELSLTPYSLEAKSTSNATSGSAASPAPPTQSAAARAYEIYQSLGGDESDDGFNSEY